MRNSESCPWPIKIRLDVDKGMSDEELEYLSSARCGKSEISAIRSPWLYGPSESAGFGKAFRSIVRWPRWLPIPFYSDHGVHLHDTFFDSEKHNDAYTHVTWSRWRNNNEATDKRVIRLTHPWVQYRRQRHYTREEGAKGTLVFVPHTRPETTSESYDWSGFLSQLSKHSAKFDPPAFMVHYHDVNKGFHKELRHLNCPIFTAGNSTSPLFIDRFYEIVKHFAYSTSPELGSSSFYSEEIGVQFFVFGKRLKIIDSDMKVHERNQASRETGFRSVFGFPPKPSQLKNQVMEDALGISIENNRTKLLRLFIQDSFRLLPRIAKRVLTRWASKKQIF